MAIFKNPIIIVSGKYKDQKGQLISTTINSDYTVTYGVLLEGSQFIRYFEDGIIRYANGDYINISDAVRDGCHGGHHMKPNQEHYDFAQAGQYNMKGTKDKISKDTITLYIYPEHNREVKHFHFYRGKDRKRGGCIYLTKAKYFAHATHDEKLSNKEIEKLVEFLKSVNKRGITNWEHLIDLWNAINENNTLDIDIPMPDYLNELNKGK